MELAVVPYISKIKVIKWPKQLIENCHQDYVSNQSQQKIKYNKHAKRFWLKYGFIFY